MSLHTLIRPLAGVLLAVLAPVLAGCAEDDFDREAAYPQTIGVTNPRPSPGVLVAQSTTPAVQQPAQPPPPPPPPQGYDEDGAPIATAPPAAGAAAGDDYADTDPSALTDFRSTLDPYGSWVDDPTYGTAWVPSSDVVGSDFSPYVTAGHWNYDDDYTWVSDYDWGWAPFHYGRWAYAAPYGWEWIPGRVYAGAWVSWRYGWGDWGYVGWAPLGPTWGWRGGVAVGLGFVGAAPYGFCATGDLFNEHVGTRMAAGGQVATIGAHTQPWTPANPTVNGHVTATPHVNGPPPQVLHIPQGAVAHGAINNRGVMQAQAFAHASTAGVMGARPPQGQSFASRAPYASPYASRVPSYGSPSTSHFGGRLGSGFRGDIASARPTYGPTYGPTRPGSSGYIGSRSGWTGYSGARSGFSGYGGARSGWTPSYGGMRGGWGGGGATTFGAAPGVHPGSASHPSGSGQTSSEGGYSGGGYHGGGSHGGGGFSGGGFGGGGFGGGGFRGGGGGGGGRGGGGHR